MQQKLHDSIDWFLTSTYSQQFDYVLMLKAFHHVYLTEEVQLGKEKKKNTTETIS